VKGDELSEGAQREGNGTHYSDGRYSDKWSVQWKNRTTRVVLFLSDFSSLCSS